ncbi:MAG: asparagine synthase-related protein [Candidatus Nanohaloarchaea archaeon]|nr:asparagine synthase-related protein [Candidatus Nanohaloarchaea archaeon]
MTGVFAGTLGGAEESVEEMAAVLEHITGEDLHWYRSDDAVLASTNRDIVQDGLAVLFNGYLFDQDDGVGELVADRYRRHGPGFVQHLDGNFRVAVYDPGKERLVLATDRVGDDFVFYTRQDGFEFSSHLAPLTAVQGYDNRLNERRMVDALIALNNVNTGGETLLEGIHQMYSSQRLVVDTEGATESTYWDCYHPDYLDVTDGEAAERIDALVHEAASRLADRGDIPLLLSGGLDSNYLLSVLDDVMEGPVETVTFGWEEAHFDHAHDAAAMFDTRHRDVTLPKKLPSQEDIWLQEQPAGISTYFDYQELRRSAGIDRFFGGGRSEFIFPVNLGHLRSLNRVRKLKPLFRAVKAAGAGEVLNRFNPKIGHGVDILTSPYRSAVVTSAWSLRRKTKWEAVDDRYRDGYVPLEKRIDERWGLDRSDYEWNYLYLQLRHYEFQDFSLFSKNMQRYDPFSYASLLDYATRVPLPQRRNRRLLKRLCRGRVPEHSVEAGGDAGPLHLDVLRRRLTENWGEHAAAMERLLERGYMDQETARPLLIPGDPGEIPATHVFYLSNMFALERWLETFIDRDRPWNRPG